MKVKVNITIAGRSYPLTVEAEEETPLRSAGKKINEMIKDFENNYHISDRQDALAMCALQIAALNEVNKSEISGISKESAERVAKINQKLLLALS